MARSSIASAVRIVLFAMAAGLVLLAIMAVRMRRPRVCVAGSAAARAAAIVPAAMVHRFLDARRILFGVGEGAVGGWGNLGDAMVAGGRIWLRNTDAASPRYYGLVHGRIFRTNFLAFVPAGAHPVTTSIIPPGEQVYRVWQQLAHRYPQGVMVEGYAKMQQLDAIAIARPPFSGLRIASHTAFYYTQPMTSSSGTWVYIAGVAAQPSSAPWWINRRRLERLVPRGQLSGVSGIADVLQLRGRPATTDSAPPPETIVGIAQLVGRSTVMRGRLRVYPVGRVEDCPAAWVR